MNDSRAKHTTNTAIQGPRLLLMLCTLALLLFGLVMMYSASSVGAIVDGSSATHEVIRQAMCALIGVFVAVAIWKILPYRFWMGRAIWIIWAIAIVLLVLTFVMGTEEYGAKRWLDLKITRIQPSEFVKIALLLMAIRILYDARVGSVTNRAALVQAILFVLIPLMFLYRTQSDLGTTLICAVGIFSVMWIGGVPKRLLGLIAGIGVAFVLFAVFGTGYRSDRMVYLDPWNDGSNGYGAGYNIIRSYYALAEGGLFGVGLGSSHEKFHYLFGSDSDFIFSIIGEELGLVGAMTVILLFIGFLIAGLRIAASADDDLGRMIAGGCTVMLVFQAFLNIGCAIGVFPTTGKPLPFISSGGSSLIATMILVGMILSVSQDAEQPDVYEQRRADLRLIRSVSDSPRDYRGRRPEPSSSYRMQQGSRSARSGYGTASSLSNIHVIAGGRSARRSRQPMASESERMRIRSEYRVIRGSRFDEVMGQSRRPMRYYERIPRVSMPRSSRR